MGFPFYFVGSQILGDQLEPLPDGSYGSLLRIFVSMNLRLVVVSLTPTESLTQGQIKCRNAK